jgi:Zn-dependent protease
MRPTILIGRIAGVRVGLNWSWAIVLALIVWSLESNVFPTVTPGLRTVDYTGMALVGAMLFFGSLLLHELGHAIVARREGIEVDGITLWLFGGVAVFRGDFRAAGAELRIALAGPLVTAALAAVLVPAAAFTSLPGPIDGVLVWLAYANVLLLAFNLLPALPLDGGRVLRATLWAVKRDFVGATRIAATVARVLALLLVALGLVLLLARGAFSGAWLAFIGWFLLQAARAEERNASFRELRGGPLAWRGASCGSYLRQRQSRW